MLQYKISKTSTKNIYNFAVISLLPILREEKVILRIYCPWLTFCILQGNRKKGGCGRVGVGGVVPRFYEYCHGNIVSFTTGSGSCPGSREIFV